MKKYLYIMVVLFILNPAIPSEEAMENKNSMKNMNKEYVPNQRIARSLAKAYLEFLFFLKDTDERNYTITLIDKEKKWVVYYESFTIIIDRESAAIVKIKQGSDEYYWNDELINEEDLAASIAKIILPHLDNNDFIPFEIILDREKQIWCITGSDPNDRLKDKKDALGKSIIWFGGIPSIILSVKNGEVLSYSLPK